MDLLEKLEEKEVKFEVVDINSLIIKLQESAQYSNIEYIRDIIYGSGEGEKKIRLRLINRFSFPNIEVIYKYKTSDSDNIKTEIEEVIYKGSSFIDALGAISGRGEFKEENSYEKIRINYVCNEEKVFYSLDIYPHGCWLEIEAGEEKIIWEKAKELGFKKTDGITKNADELYLDWIKKHDLKEQWDIRFGLTGKK